jgi:hypothetical protein
MRVYDFRHEMVDIAIKYISEADHLAALAEKEGRILAYKEDYLAALEQIAALQADIGLLHRKMTSPRITEKDARIKELTEALKKIAKMGEAKEMRHPLVDDGFEPINPILKVGLEMAAKIATAALTAQEEA